MTKWLFRLIWIPVFIIAVLFLVANRHPVAISLDPFSQDNPAVATAALPLWLWLTVTLFLGVGLGAAAMWMSGGDRRQKARAEHKELKAVRRQLETALAEKRAAEAKVRNVVEEPPLLESAEP
ncbi:MAG: lipopolysaccharide assembly protein LapA domain-containing protein [Hyphococcus sp.]